MSGCVCAPQACRDGEYKAGISCLVLTIATGLWSIWLWLGKHGTHDNRYDASLILIVQQEADFDLLEAQNKELLTGRLAMVGIAGMVIEELVTHSKLF